MNEKIDVYSIGNNFLTILTGKIPYRELNADSDSIVQGYVQDGILPYIDPAYESHGSPEEKLLVDIIKRCFEYIPIARPSIFDIVKWLKRGYI